MRPGPASGQEPPEAPGPGVPAPTAGFSYTTEAAPLAAWLGALAWRRRPERPCSIYAAEIRVSDSADPESCEQACPTGALTAHGGRLLADPGRCLVCLACMALCGGLVEIVPGWRCPGDGEA